MTQPPTATLSFNDGTPPADFPLLSGTVGPDVIDIRNLYATTGKFTYDPGFMSTASCKSAITFAIIEYNSSNDHHDGKQYS